MEFTLNFGKIFSDFKLLFSFPGKLIKNVKKDNWTEAITFFIVISLIGTFFFYAYYYAIYPQLAKLFPDFFPSNFEYESILVILQVAVFSYFLGIVVTFVYALLFAAWLFVFVRKFDYKSAYKITVYSLSPLSLLSWVPLINFAVVIYMLYLYVNFVKEFYEFKLIKSIIIALGGLIAISWFASVIFGSILV